MVFLTKVKTELNSKKGAEFTMPSEMNENYTQIRATDLSALLFKGNKINPIGFLIEFKHISAKSKFKFIKKKGANMHDSRAIKRRQFNPNQGVNRRKKRTIT